MKNVVVLEPKEYEELITVKEAHKSLIEGLEEKVEDVNALQEFVRDWLY